LELKSTYTLTELKKYIDNLNPISADSWNKLSGIFSEKTLLKGDFFIREGQTANQIGFLQDGIIRAFYRNNEGLEYNKHFFVSSCFIGGYASLITGTTNQINQQALSNCQILVANFSDFTALYDTHPDIERAARKLAEFFFVHKEQREIEIVLLDADKRYLLFQKQFPFLEQQIPQYHIASYLGITPTQLSRIRRKFTQK
jgi:CRP-like cAMP-binding protein